MAYYDRRHSGIDETNILQVVKAIEGETITVCFCTSADCLRQRAHIWVSRGIALCLQHASSCNQVILQVVNTAASPQFASMQ
jgi:hypothetical protein